MTASDSSIVQRHTSSQVITSLLSLKVSITTFASIYYIIIKDCRKRKWCIISRYELKANVFMSCNWTSSVGDTWLAPVIIHQHFEIGNLILIINSRNQVPGRRHRQYTHCRASQSSCCRPWHPLQQEPVVHLLTVGDRKLLDKSRSKLFTLQPSSSLVPAGSGSVLPTPLVEWRPGSSLLTYQPILYKTVGTEPIWRNWSKY